jgi:serine phosphatase RsbU (regulator of sigma subunit)/predicted enzyme related to lactoylglutathione lyase
MSHLRIHTAVVPVNDLNRSVEFYEGALGFRVVHRGDLAADGRFAVVAPPDGASVLVLSEADPNGRIGTATGVSFVTDDLAAQHGEWSARGVRFVEAPTSAPLGARYAVLLDPDDNAFHLVEADILTEQIDTERRAVAERAARERRAADELAIATKIQAGLFPQHRPSMATLDYAGVCLQARRVGGDYFDFLKFGDGRLSLVIGDVSGKGLGAALLMANLQAHVRSHFALHRDDLPAFLSSVNDLFHESSPSASYATLFCGVYDDRTHRLRWINCGHPPPIVLRDNGTIELLSATGHALGMFDRWSGLAREVELGGGDLLLLYTDGVTEAVDVAGTDFGLDRLVEVLRAGQPAGAQAILDRCVRAVQQFSHGEQQDDITMVVAQAGADRF